MNVAPGQRAEQLEEIVAILHALWTGEPVDHQGRFWTLQGARLSPARQRSKLELWLGGGRTAVALERIGRSRPQARRSPIEP